jgi:hypothetical protein
MNHEIADLLKSAFSGGYAFLFLWLLVLISDPLTRIDRMLTRLVRWTDALRRWGPGISPGPVLTRGHRPQCNVSS